MLGKDEEILLGGQAVIEGVMMRSKDVMAVAVRKPDGGISILKEGFISFLTRYPFLRIPIIRGAAVLIQALVLGVKSLNYSAEVAMVEEKKENNPQNGRGEKEKVGGTTKIALAFTIILALALGIALFFFLPLFLTELLKKVFPILEVSLLFNLVDGLIRIFIFVLYIFSISLIKDIKKIFQYHGAEHKTVYAHEAGEELTVTNVKKYSTLHPRCGTSFLLFVMVIAILLFSFLPAHQPLYIKIWPRLALLPLIAGISYEIIRYSARRMDNMFFKGLVWPGLLFQKITTAEPSEEQISVAIEALKNVRPPSPSAEIVPT
jgi:uncharacterized protein YqhQ